MFDGEIRFGEVKTPAQYPDGLPAEAGRPAGSISTLVSLFLLLLVFFIVLFSIAHPHRPRVDAVVDSLDAAFGRLPSALGVIARPDLQSAEAMAPEGFARRVSALITGFAPLQPVGASGDGDSILAIDLAPESLFPADAVQMRGGLGGMTEGLALALQGRREGSHYRLALTAVLPYGTLIGSPAEALANGRLAVMAAALYAKGCPADALAVAVDYGEKPAMRFDFTLVTPAPDGD